MGERGPLAQIVRIDPDPLADLVAPEWLSEVARQHWDKHKEWLTKNNILNAESADAFAVLCEVWGRLAELRSQPTDRLYLATFKSYQQLAKVFRLLPGDKPGAAPPPRHSQKKEFKF